MNGNVIQAEKDHYVRIASKCTIVKGQYVVFLMLLGLRHQLETLEFSLKNIRDLVRRLPDVRRDFEDRGKDFCTVALLVAELEHIVAAFTVMRKESPSPVLQSMRNLTKLEQSKFAQVAGAVYSNDRRIIPNQRLLLLGLKQLLDQCTFSEQYQSILQNNLCYTRNQYRASGQAFQSLAELTEEVRRLLPAKSDPEAQPFDGLDDEEIIGIIPELRGEA